MTNSCWLHCLSAWHFSRLTFNVPTWFASCMSRWNKLYSLCTACFTHEQDALDINHWAWRPEHPPYVWSMQCRGYTALSTGSHIRAGQAAKKGWWVRWWWWLSCWDCKPAAHETCHLLYELQATALKGSRYDCWKALSILFFSWMLYWPFYLASQEAGR